MRIARVGRRHDTGAAINPPASGLIARDRRRDGVGLRGDAESAKKPSRERAQQMITLLRRRPCPVAPLAALSLHAERLIQRSRRTMGPSFERDRKVDSIGNLEGLAQPARARDAECVGAVHQAPLPSANSSPCTGRRRDQVA